MKKWLIRILLLACFVAGFASLSIPTQNVRAAMCSGSNCTGLYADSSCSATGVGTPKYYGGSKIESRQSTLYCLAQWTRITNVSGYTRWTAGDTRYGGSNYNSYQSVQSGAMIAHNQTVFTPMVGNDNGTGFIDTLSCGKTSASQMSLPVSGSSPNTHPSCTGVW